MRRLSVFLPLLAGGLVAPLPPTAAPVIARAPIPVVVFEGSGLGHGLGLPLDAADVAVREEGAGVTELLRRFYPGTTLGSRDGLVRVQVAATDDLRAGIEVVLPEGGRVRDGRTASVAPSFPLSVAPGQTVRLSFDDGFFRAEVLDGASVNDTRPLVSATTTPASIGDPTAHAGFAASPGTVWVDPKGDGPFVIGTGKDRRSYRGLLEVVAEAGQLHAVNEVGVETYLRGLDLTPPGTPPLEPETLAAAVVAARTYALRSAAADLKVGGFHLYADERSNRYVGEDRATPGLATAVAATRHRVVLFEGQPAVALVTVSAGGRTASPAEVFGPEAPRLPYLAPVSYAPEREFRWRVDMALDEVARRLGYRGEATSLFVSDTGPSGRPIELTITGVSGNRTVGAARFHRALRLPSTSFRTRVEARDVPVEVREGSPPFQELPGEPAADEPLRVSGAAPGTRGGRELPPPYVLGAIGALGTSVAALLVANLQRAVRLRRQRRAARRRHPSWPPSEPDSPSELGLSIRL